MSTFIIDPGFTVGGPCPFGLIQFEVRSGPARVRRLFFRVGSPRGGTVSDNCFSIPVDCGTVRAMLQLARGTCPAKALAEEALVAPDLVSNPDQGLLPLGPLEDPWLFAQDR